MVWQTVRLQRPDLDYLAGLDRKKLLLAGWHEWQQILHAIRFHAMDLDRDTPPSHVLLVFDIPIAGEQYIPQAFSKREQLAILLGSKTCVAYRLALVTHRDEVPLQCNRKTLIDQNSHFPKRARTSALASSSAAIAVSRLTPGYCSRNSSRVSPPSR